ncbi:hypothetical protein [Burkholderia sp. BCC1047]|uniref:hypothetical protein n=1 Tax=Burkholderia sp. BCC1047 TaxID=2676299 RepID=UPI00158E8B09|nr:hypothetical protein [Burkholderia sp. BCC1047]
MMVMSFDAEKDETRLADESAKRPMRGAGNRACVIQYANVRPHQLIVLILATR